MIGIILNGQSPFRDEFWSVVYQRVFTVFFQTWPVAQTLLTFYLTRQVGHGVTLRRVDLEIDFGVFFFLMAIIKSLTNKVVLWLIFDYLSYTFSLTLEVPYVETLFLR